jgi:hypothetical protein
VAIRPNARSRACTCSWWDNIIAFLLYNPPRDTAVRAAERHCGADSLEVCIHIEVDQPDDGK